MDYMGFGVLCLSEALDLKIEIKFQTQAVNVLSVVTTLMPQFILA